MSKVLNFGEKDKRLKYTGSMGSINESTNIVYTFAQNYLSQLDPKNHFFEVNSLHIHFPTGGFPKDGPSAGISIVTSLLSLAMNVPIKDSIVMTGEITLSGKVLDVHGIKEKVIAVKSVGIHELLLPQNNHSEWDELDPLLKEGITVHFVESFDEVYNLAFESKQEPKMTSLPVVTNQINPTAQASAPAVF